MLKYCLVFAKIIEFVELDRECGQMKRGIVTPLGEIHIYIDGIRTDYEYEQNCCGILALQQRPVAGSYRIVISKKDWKTIRCVVSLCNQEIPNDGASGERYLYSEFVKDNIVLTIGAGDEQTAFETNRIRYGMEYVRKTTADYVVFGVAWATDYEGRYDIRTQLATDLY